MDVGQKIKKYLVENGVSQSFLSQKTKISSSKLNLSLNGKRKLQFEEYEIICWALGLGVDYFLEPRLPEVKGA